MRQIVPLMLMFLLCACTPQAYTMLVEAKQDNPSGVDISGKTVSILYLTPQSVMDSTFNACFADGLAQGIEAEFFDGEKTVEMFSMVPDPGVDYSDQSVLVDMLLKTNTDVLIFVDTPRERKARIYVLDSMGKTFQVHKFTKNATAAFLSDDLTLFGSDAQYLGFDFSKTFIIKWEKQTFSLVYFDNMDNGWINAIGSAEAFDWNRAIDTWMTELNRKSAVQRSCASYNIAVGCYMLGEYALAAEWLDRSDSAQPLSLSHELRKKLENKLPNNQN